MVNRVFLVGYMGSGKSTIGKFLARDLGWQFIDMDDLFEQNAGCSISDFFAQHGQDAFRQAEADLLRQLASADKAVIATGGGAPCFHSNMEVMNNAGLTIYINVLPVDLARRLAPAKAHRPILADKSDDELESFIAQQLQTRDPFYRQAKMTVDGERLPFASYKLFVETFPDDL